MRFPKLCFLCLLFPAINGYAQNITTAINGLTKVGNNTVKLGGTTSLSENTDIDLGTSFYFNLKKSTSNYFTVLNGGNVGINTLTPAYRLDVNGTLKATGFNFPTGAGLGRLLVSNTAGGDFSWLPLGTALQQLRVKSDLSGLEFFTPSGGAGSVTSFSFTNGNGFTGTVTNASTTPALSLSTTLNGLLRGNGSALITGQANLASEVTGILPYQNGGTGLSTLGTANQQLRVNAGGTGLEYFTPSGGGGGLLTANNGLTATSTNVQLGGTGYFDGRLTRDTYINTYDGSTDRKLFFNTEIVANGGGLFFQIDRTHGAMFRAQGNGFNAQTPTVVRIGNFDENGNDSYESNNTSLLTSQEILNNGMGSNGSFKGLLVRLNGNNVDNNYNLRGIEINTRHHYTNSFNVNGTAGNIALKLTANSVGAQGWLKVLTYAIYADSGRVYSRDSVMFGTTTPGAFFHVNGTSRFDLGGDNTGDIFYRNATGQFTRLPIGTTNGHVLTVNNGLPVWAAATGGGGSSQWLNSGSNIYFNGGNVSIGLTSIPAGYKLAVAGNIITEKVRVKLQSSGWPDYVFHPKYQLPSLKELESYIEKNKHLPDVPSAADVEANGLDLGDNQAILLKKIEELTLYIIDINKKVEKLSEENAELKKKLVPKK